MSRKALQMRIVGQFINQDRKSPMSSSLLNSFAEPSKGNDIYSANKPAGPNPLTFGKPAPKKKRRLRKSSIVSSTMSADDQA